ncbi:MAG TPA: serine hydrolase domain-containing protein [Thermoanaerobaculia bacterium]|jgi:CubicO group peptidase (beta-lactamase class C family)
MRARLPQVLLLLVLIASEALAAGGRASLLKARLEPVIERTMAENHIPGLAIGVVDHGRLVYARGFGVATIGEAKPITTRSLFHMASVTKPFVATAILQLVERGKIDLDERVTKYLPYFRLNDDRAATITVRQLLAHIAGIPDVEDYHWDQPEYDDQALERYVRGLSSTSLDSAPGARYAYSNTGFEILGDVIAKVSGESFETYVQKHILAPLRMNRSTLLVRETVPGLLTSPHIAEDGAVVKSAVFPYHRAHAPSSTMYSNVEDMSRWMLANLNRGTLGRARILNAATYELLWQPHAATTKPGRQVGLSWFITQRAGHRIISHSGDDIGFQSYIALVPDERSGVVIMSNFSPPDRHYPSEIASAALDLLLTIEE